MHVLRAKVNSVQEACACANLNLANHMKKQNKKHPNAKSIGETLKPKCLGTLKNNNICGKIAINGYSATMRPSAIHTTMGLNSTQATGNGSHVNLQKLSSENS